MARSLWRDLESIGSKLLGPGIRKPQKRDVVTLGGPVDVLLIVYDPAPL